MLMMCFLLGCSSQTTVERVYDELLLPAMAPTKELTLALPPHASRTVLSGEDGGQLYFCKDYTLTLQTTVAGDLNRTLQDLCGYGTEKLTLLETRSGGIKRYDWTWSSAAEAGTQVGRGTILDDGDYHYCVTAMADEVVSGNLRQQWDALFDTVSLKR